MRAHLVAIGYVLAFGALCVVALTHTLLFIKCLFVLLGLMLLSMIYCAAYNSAKGVKSEKTKRRCL